MSTRDREADARRRVTKVVASNGARTRGVLVLLTGGTIAADGVRSVPDGMDAGASSALQP